MLHYTLFLFLLRGKNPLNIAVGVLLLLQPHASTLGDMLHCEYTSGHLKVHSVK